MAAGAPNASPREAPAKIESWIPPPSETIRRRELAAIAEANRWGLTGIHDAGEPQDVLDVFDDWRRAVGVSAATGADPGAGGSGASDAANLLKPALARGTLRTIAATTWDE